MALRVLILSIFIFLSGCDSSRDPNSEAPSVYPNGGRLLLAAGNQTQGRLELVSLDAEPGLRQRKAVLPIHFDAAVKHFSGFGKTIVLNRFGMDSLYVLDKGSAVIRAAYSLEKGANPQDVVMLSPTEVVVSQRSKGQLLMWNTATGSVKETDLSQFAFELGIPDMNMLQLSPTGSVWVSLQRLQDRMKVTDFSSVAEVDLKKRSVRNHALKFKNPVTPFRTDAHGNRYLGSAGKVGFYSEQDGGIEVLNANGASRGVVITESALQGDIIDFEILSDDLGVALVSSPGTSLVSFDPGSGKRTDTLIAREGYDLVKLLFDRKRELLIVSDRNRNRPLIHFFDARTMKKTDEVALELPVWEMDIEEP